MSDVEEARQNFEANFKTVKGFKAIYSSNHWLPTVPKEAAPEPKLVVFVSRAEVVDLMPESFMGYECEYRLVAEDFDPHL